MQCYLFFFSHVHFEIVIIIDLFFLTIRDGKGKCREKKLQFDKLIFSNRMLERKVTATFWKDYFFPFWKFVNESMVCRTCCHSYQKNGSCFSKTKSDLVFSELSSFNNLIYRSDWSYTSRLLQFNDTHGWWKNEKNMKEHVAEVIKNISTIYCVHFYILFQLNHTFTVSHDGSCLFFFFRTSRHFRWGRLWPNRAILNWPTLTNPTLATSTLAKKFWRTSVNLNWPTFAKFWAAGVSHDSPRAQTCTFEGPDA